MTGLEWLGFALIAFAVGTLWPAEDISGWTGNTFVAAVGLFGVLLLTGTWA